MKYTENSERFFICSVCGLPSKEVNAQYTAVVTYSQWFSGRSVEMEQINFEDGDLVGVQYEHANKICPNLLEFAPTTKYPEDFVIDFPCEKEDYVEILRELWGDETDLIIQKRYGNEDTLWEAVLKEVEALQRK